MVVDPAVLAYALPHQRPCHMWAKKSLFTNKWAAWVITAFGGIPVDRATKNNQSLFQITFDTLQGGGVIGSFPEGTSYTLPHMLPLKDGTSWAALQYAVQLEDRQEEKLTTLETLDHERQQLQIVPTGITYTDKRRWRSGCIVMFGEALDVQSYVADFRKDERQTVKTLTHDLTRAFRKLTINAPDWEAHLLGTKACTIVFSEVTELPPEHFVQVNQDWIDFFVVYTNQPDVDALRHLILDYVRGMDSLKLTDQDMQMLLQCTGQQRWSTATVAAHLLENVAKLIVEIPLSLPALAIHLPIYALAKLAERFERHEESRAQIKIVTTLVVFPPAYMALFWWVWHHVFLGSFSGFIASAVLILTYALYHLAYVDFRYDTFKGTVAIFRVVCVLLGYGQRSGKGQMEKLIMRRQQLTRTLLVMVQRYSEQVPGQNLSHDSDADNSPSVSKVGSPPLKFVRHVLTSC
ncbi:hypothetical protein IWQ61_000648 [Dispira simplex]|nr:hypothetical protein IWQ61_000648 [Dispira simplex]